MKFFDILDFPVQFLELDPEEWSQNSEYMNARKVVSSLRVVNDHAERAIKLMQTFNKKLTNSEEDFQDVLHISSHFSEKIGERSRKMSVKKCKSL